MKRFLALLVVSLTSYISFAGEPDLTLPDLKQTFFSSFGISGWQLLLFGYVFIIIGISFGAYQFFNVRKIPAHKSMLNISKIIYETCKTYLVQQGKFLVYLFLIIGTCITFYFLGLVPGTTVPKMILILIWTVLGILG